MEQTGQVELACLRKRKGIYKVKKGVSINKIMYDAIVKYILSCINACKEKEVSLNELIDMAPEGLSKSIHGNLWYLLQVKQDLEAREIVKTVINHKYEQIVRLNRKPRSRFR